ncbi:MAG: hypothetical protein K6T83_02015 [Alicyclobacillus sp.]|nr:hypothetical protein [Alicyclobacillus sp.]
MSLTRENILQAMVSELGSLEYILAMWLEGSDGTSSLDQYSDIDLVCYTKDGFLENAASAFDACVARLGHVDIAYEQPSHSTNHRFKVYHIQGTPPSLLIDVTFQSEGFPVSFLKEDKTVVPVVLVDKAGIVKFRDLDADTFRAQLRSQLTNAQGVYSQRSRAIKYTKRGLFLESLIYYHKYVLNPFAYREKEYVVRFSNQAVHYPIEQIVLDALSPYGVRIPRRVRADRMGELYYSIVERAAGKSMASFSTNAMEKVVPDLIDQFMKMTGVSITNSSEYGAIQPSGDGTYSTSTWATYWRKDPP